MNNATLIERLTARFPQLAGAAAEFRGDLALQVAPGDLLAVAAFLRDELGYTFLENLCAVDYLGRDPRFEVATHLTNIAAGHRVCLKVGVPEERPQLPSLTGLFPTANYQEREAYDLMGLIFTGHPALSRILMPEDWVGHPQRKDHPLGDEEVAFSFNQDRIYARKPFAKE